MRWRFGKDANMVGLSSIMGNYRPGDMMDLRSQYTGMTPSQYSRHVGEIPLDLRSNFYRNVV